MMKKMVLTVLWPAIHATTRMTLFSYVLSSLFRANFKEPVLLGMLLQRGGGPEAAGSPLSAKNRLAGWLLHYAAGLAWATAAHALDARRGKLPGKALSSMYGLACGLASAAIWSQFFQRHPNPPRIPYAAFYCQLVPAHVVFMLALERSRRLLLRSGMDVFKKR